MFSMSYLERTQLYSKGRGAATMTDLEVVLSQIESLESEREKLRRDSVHAAKDRWLAELEHELAALRSKADALRERGTSTAGRRGESRSGSEGKLGEKEDS